MKIKLIILLFIVPSTLYCQELLTKLIVINKDSTIKNIGILSFSPFYRDFDKPLNFLSESDFVRSEKVELNLEVNKSKVLSLMVMGRTENVFVTPGDIITLNINRDGNTPLFTFYGKNAAHYSYLSASENYINSIGASPKFDKNIGLSAYKSEADAWMKMKLKFLSDFELANKVSDDFIEFSKEQIDYKYVQLLYEPMNSTLADFKDIPDGYFYLADSIFRKNNYSIKYLNSNNLLAYTYRFIIYGEPNYLENFDRTLQKIRTLFKGTTKSYLLSNLIGVYAKKQSDIYRASLVKLINEAPKFILDPLSLSYFERREIEYNKLNRNFPDEVLSKTYLKSMNSDSKISLKDLLEQYKGDATYIDFWASWCIPCREDNATSKMAKEFLQSKQVKYIYISIDKEADEMKWKKASTDDKITMDQYILMNGLKAELAQYLKITSIPRYIILNEQHKIKNIDAPRPSFTQLNKLKGAIINATKE